MKPVNVILKQYLYDCREIMSLNNMGVGAEGLLAAKSALSAPSDQFGNDGRVEEMWAMKAAEHAEVYFNLLCSVEPTRLKLTGNKELDDTIYEDFQKSFPDLNVASFTEDDIKNDKAKAAWRKFSESYKDVEDFSLGCLLRLNASQDYTEENTCIAIKIQFFAIEIARNRQGHNDALRTNFKPTKRTARSNAAPKSTPANAPAPDTNGSGPQIITQGGVNMTEVEFELQQIFGGTHPLLKNPMS